MNVAINSTTTDDQVVAADHRLGMRRAIISACWGAIAQVMVRDSSVVIIFAALIGASEMVAVFSTSVMDLGICLLMLPFACLANRLGLKRQIVLAVVVGAVALSVMAAAPWLKGAASATMMACLVVFAIAMAAYIAGWFPLLEIVVPAAERGLFFGRMRFCWQLVAAIFIFASGWYVGRYATVGRLQLIIALAALAGLGRAWFIARIPVSDVAAIPQLDLREALADVIDNRQLCGFSVYLFFLYVAAGAMVPVAFVFARNHLHMPDNLVVMLSVVLMAGLIVGYAIGGRIVHRYGVKGVFVGAHLGFATLNLLLLGVRSGGVAAVAGLCLIICVYGLLAACASIAVSSEMLALARPANKAISIAVSFSLYSAGIGGSRALASLVLGSGMLAPEWSVAGLAMTRYHSLFLLFGGGIIFAMLLLVLVPALVRDVARLPAA